MIAYEVCYCEHKNGAPGQNGIMCGFDQSFQRVSECSADEWCMGPHDMITAELGSSQLCKKGARYNLIPFVILKLKIYKNPKLLVIILLIDYSNYQLWEWYDGSQL